MELVLSAEIRGAEIIVVLIVDSSEKKCTLAFKFLQFKEEYLI
jgi:hypothetical protein